MTLPLFRFHSDTVHITNVSNNFMWYCTYNELTMMK